MKYFNLVTVFMLLILFSACSGKKERRGPDYDKIKAELNLDEATLKKFDAITQKYDQERGKYFSEAKTSGNMDRVKMLEKLEMFFEEQNTEMAEVLTPEQLEKFKEFINKSVPKSPNYSDKLLAEMKDSLQMNADQEKIFTAINNTFVQSFIDAHDKYHGNNEAAKQYWNQFDGERKKAIKAVLSEDQYTVYLKLSEKEGFVGRE